MEYLNYDKTNIQEDYLPEGSVLIQTLNNTRADLYALCLFDLDSTNMLINQQSLPPQNPLRSGPAQLFTTTQDESSTIFEAKNIYFPNFCKLRRIPQIQLRLFDSPN